MKKFNYPVKPINLHLFDGAAGDGGTASTAGADTGTEGVTNNTAVNTQAAQGVSDNDDLVKQVANASRQDVVVASPDDDKRAQFESYIKDEGKTFFDEKVQKIINGRFKETKTLEANAKTIEPMLSALASLYGVDVKDLGALSEAVLNDNRMYEERAKQNGVSVEVQKKFDRIEQENAQLRAADEQRAQIERQQEIIDDWNRQAEELKAEYPDFDLNVALDTSTREGKDFYDLLVRGVPVKAAFNVAYPKAYADKVEKGITDNIKARGMRPGENGASSFATARNGFDVSKLTPAQRREFANRAARGEHITFT